MQACEDMTGHLRKPVKKQIADAEINYLPSAIFKLLFNNV
jgi:hypothetical protein